MFTNEMKGIIKMFVSAIITAFTIAGIIFTFTIESKMNKAREDGYNAGYHAAIEDAELVSSNNEGYTLSFNGEVNWYTFD